MERNLGQSFESRKSPHGPQYYQNESRKQNPEFPDPDLRHKLFRASSLVTDGTPRSMFPGLKTLFGVPMTNHR